MRIEKYLVFCGLGLMTAQSFGATISGTITFSGKAPEMKPITLTKECQPKAKGPAKEETLVLGNGSKMANVYVHIKSGLPAKQWPTPKESAVLDQTGCRYVPHVIAVQTGQNLDILNSDGIMHNINAKCPKNSNFNKGMPGAVKKANKTFSKAEICDFKCDVHPWMKSFLAISDHPFFTVTKDAGTYTLQNVPAGTYEIEAWHEKLPPQTMTVTVAETDNKTADFTFKAPNAP